MTQHQRFLSLLPSQLPPFTEDERGIQVHPQSVEDVENIVRAANTTHTPIYPDLGQPQNPAERVFIDFSGLNRVLHYRSEELLIKTETGVSMAQLMQTLDAQDQRLGLIYSPFRSLLSVLGEETVSLSGTQYGSLRQRVVGVEAITGDGHRIHYGGEVVKNVTGYDLNKLFLGSRHRYGVLTQVILKVEPKAEMARSFLFHVEAFAEALALSQKLSNSLSSIEILTLFKTKTTFGWQILVTLSGYKAVVQAESDTIHEEVSHLNADLQELYLAPKALDQWVQRLDWTHYQEPDALVVRIALPQKQLFDLPYRFLSYPWFKVADMMLPLKLNQLFLRWISVNIPQLEQLQLLQSFVREQGGFVEILRVSPSLKLDVSAFNADPQPVIRGWTERLKQQYDPRGVLVGDFPGMLLQATMELGAS